jgi:hypothetical protein
MQIKQRSVIVLLIVSLFLCCVYAARVYLRNNPTAHTTQVYIQGDLREATSLELPQLPSEERLTVLDMCDNARSMRETNDRVAGKQPTMASDRYHLVGEYRHERADNSITAVTYPAGEAPARTEDPVQQASPQSASAGVSCVQVMATTEGMLAVRQAVGVVEPRDTGLGTVETASDFFNHAHNTCLFTKRIFGQSANTDPSAQQLDIRVDTMPMQHDTAAMLHVTAYDTLFGKDASSAAVQNVVDCANTPQVAAVPALPVPAQHSTALADNCIQQQSWYQLGAQYGASLGNLQGSNVVGNCVQQELYQQYSFVPERKLQETVTAERQYVSPDLSASPEDYNRYKQDLAACNAAKYDKPAINVQLHRYSDDYLTCTVDGLPIDVAIHIPLKPTGGSAKDQLLRLERMRWNLFQFNEEMFATLLLCRSEQEFASEYAMLLYVINTGFLPTPFYWYNISRRYDALLSSPKARKQVVRC